MFSLNPFSNHNNRCHHLFANGHQCRNLIPNNTDTHLCRFHHDKAEAAQLEAQQQAEAVALVAELYGQLSDLNSPLAVAKVLSNLFRLIAENRIHPKQASSLNSTARGVLRALKDHQIATRHAASAAEEDLLEQEAEERQGRAQALTQVVTEIAQSRPAPVAAGLARPGSRETIQPLQNENPAQSAVHVDSQPPASQPIRKPSNKTTPIPADQPCNTYKEALLATLRHSNMTQEEIDEYIKQHCDRLPYEPNSAKPKKPFIKFRPRRFRWSNSW